jgi:endonuclease/exonuclease/phosphatase family metal-dependent hydrolase
MIGKKLTQEPDMRTRPISRLIVPASVLLFTVQGVRVLFSMLFGILYDQLFAGEPGPWMIVSLLLVLAAFSAPVLSKSLQGRRGMRTLAVVSALARLALSINQAELRFWGALVLAAAGGLYLAALLRDEFSLALPSLVAALALEGFLRAYGDSYDLSLRQNWILVQAIWSAWLVWVVLRPAEVSPQADHPPGGLSRSGGLALGSILFLELSLLGLPGGVAGWSVAKGQAADWNGALHAWLTPMLLALTWLALVPTVRASLLRFACQRRGLPVGMGILLSLVLMGGSFLNGALSLGALVLAQALTLVALVCLLDGLPDRASNPGPGLALGGLLFLALNVLNAFTFTYPYTLPVLRGMGWAVYLAAGLILTLSLAVRRAYPVRREALWRDSFPAALGGLILVVLAAWAAWPQPALPVEGGTLTAATWNIHYGYDVDWRFNLDQMAMAIERNGVEVIALQEVDAGRMTGFSVDDAYYLARFLRMNAVFLPTLEGQTGVALLYRGDKAPHGAAWLPSLQEQTGIIHVLVGARQGQPVHAYATWMGLSREDTLRQIEAALDFIGESSPALYGGDFNARLEEAVPQAVQMAGFDDPFQELGIDPPPTSPAVDPQDRIDYVWIRGLTPVEARVDDSLASDHRMVVIKVEG